MNQQKTSAQLKALAKEQLLGNYGKIAGAFAVILAIYFAVFSIAYTAGMAGLLGTALVGGGQVTPTLIGSFIILFLIALIIVALFYCMEVGLVYMALQISRGSKVEVKDVFFSFTHHPDKVLGLFFLFYFANILMSVPACAVEIIYSDEVMDIGSPMVLLCFSFIQYYIWGQLLVPLCFH